MTTTMMNKNRAALAVALLLCLPTLRAADTEQQAWDNFIGWAQTQPGLPSRDEWKRYQEKLIADGFTADAASERMALLGRMANQHREQLSLLAQNRLYAATEQHRFSTAPNAFLVATLRDLELKPGKALDVAMGQGRNALYLATLGWNVTGIDVAEEGLRVAQEGATAAGTKITTIPVRFEDFDYGREQWDLICFSYTDAPVIDPNFVARIVTALKPGGLVLIERPHCLLDEKDPELGDPRPSDLPNALPNAWKDLQILQYEDLIGYSEWQQTSVDRHQKKLRIIRLLATKR